MAKIKKTTFSFSKYLPLNILMAILFFVAAMAALNSEKQRIKLRVLGMQTEMKASRETILKWEQLMSERPDYRDGWIQLAVLHYKSNNKQKAREALFQAKQLDPNNETILQAEKLWGF